ncbi:MAG TPA: MFS transporter, partial [Gammaproteobacteria bacterium]|nr:MFS transporter [Gammaproteobacteria bacterium]
MSAANNSVNSQYPVPPQPTWLLVLIVSTSIFATTIITPSLPGITELFSVTAQQTQMVITGFLAATAVGQLFFGPFSDRFGRRIPLLAGLGLYLAGSILALVATDLSVLVLARCVQGVGAAAAMVLSRVIINDTHAPRAAAASMAAVMSATALAP